MLRPLKYGVTTILTLSSPKYQYDTTITQIWWYHHFDFLISPHIEQYWKNIYTLLSYPHFGPKNTRSNFFLFLIISNSLCLFYNLLLCYKRTFCCYNLQFSCIQSHPKCFSCITSPWKGSLGPLHVFLHFIPIFA